MSPAEANDAFQRGDGFVSALRRLRGHAYRHLGTIAAVATAVAAARGGQRVGQLQGRREMGRDMTGLLKDAEGAGRANARAAYERQLRSVRANARTAGYMQAARHHEGMANRQDQLTSVAL